MLFFGECCLWIRCSRDYYTIQSVRYGEINVYAMYENLVDFKIILGVKLLKRGGLILKDLKINYNTYRFHWEIIDWLIKLLHWIVAYNEFLVRISTSFIQLKFIIAEFFGKLTINKYKNRAYKRKYIVNNRYTKKWNSFVIAVCQ